MSAAAKRRAASKNSRDAEKKRIEGILESFQPIERSNLRRLLTLYKHGRCPKWSEEKLAAVGLIGQIDREEPSQIVDSQESLTAALRAHYAGRISVDLCQQTISHWRLGSPGHGVPNGAPLPPPRRGNKYVVNDWIEWIDRHILPTHGVNGHTAVGPVQQTIFQQAQEAEAERQIIERNRAKRAEEIELGNFIPIQEHIGRLKIIGQVLNQAITDSIEKTIVQTITDAAKVLPIDEQKMAEFRQQIQQSCEAAADAQRRALAGAMLQATDKTL